MGKSLITLALTSLLAFGADTYTPEQIEQARKNRKEQEAKRLFETSQQLIFGKVIGEGLSLKFKANSDLSFKAEADNKTEGDYVIEGTLRCISASLESVYTIGVQTESGALYNINVADSSGMKKEHLNALVEKGTTIAFLRGNIEYSLLDTKTNYTILADETFFGRPILPTSQFLPVQYGTKRADRIKIIALPEEKKE